MVQRASIDGDTDSRALLSLATARVPSSLPGEPRRAAMPTDHPRFILGGTAAINGKRYVTCGRPIRSVFHKKRIRLQNASWERRPRTTNEDRSILEQSRWPVIRVA